MSKTVTIASFDIGKKNFAFYVEENNKTTIRKLRKEYDNFPKNMKRRVKGKMNNHISGLLDKLFLSGKYIEMKVKDIRETNEDIWDIQNRKNLIAYMEKHRYLWDTTDIFVIEQQYFNTFSGRGKKSKGTGANVDAIKIAECLLTWILFNYPEAEITMFGAQYKTQMLGAPDSLTKPQRKKWAITKGSEIFESRGEDEAIKKAQRYKKKKQKIDDIYDCVVMCQAFKYRNLIAKF